MTPRARPRSRMIDLSGARTKRALIFLDSLDSKNRYAILYRIEEGNKSETRARRIAKYVAMLA
jgi:uncharacterized protein YdeI (YjbR/CyaY-like superfamily)